MQANHKSGTPSCIPDENLLFGLEGVRRTTCRAANFRGRLMAPLCKTWCNYTQLLELSFSSPRPPPLAPALLLPIRPAPVSCSSLFSALSLSLSISLPLSQKILCRRFYCRIYPRILSMGVARTWFKKRRKRRGRGKSKAVERILILF